MEETPKPNKIVSEEDLNARREVEIQKKALRDAELEANFPDTV